MDETKLQSIAQDAFEIWSRLRSMQTQIENARLTHAQKHDFNMLLLASDRLRAGAMLLLQFAPKIEEILREAG